MRYCPLREAVSASCPPMRDGDSVRLTLALDNFQIPLVDFPTPGQGKPMVHDARGMRLIRGFKTVGDDITHMVGPAFDLDGVDKFVVALHYMNEMRIRPAVADTLESVEALRAQPPTFRILSRTVTGSELWIVLERHNFDGFHIHIYKDELIWPGSPNYQLCTMDTCKIRANTWQSANTLVLAIHKDNHDILKPIVQDTLLAPFSP